MILKEAYRRFVQDISVSRSASTARAYSQSLRMFRLFLSEREISDNSPAGEIDAELFIEFPSWLASYKYDGKARFSRQTLNVYVSGVKALMEHLVVAGVVQFDYQQSVRLKMAYAEIYKKRQTNLPRWPKKDDVDKMKAAVYAMNEPSPRKERDVALVELLASTGCRNAEIVGLNLQHIDMANRSAVVTGKGRKQRIVFFSPEAKSALSAYWKAAGIAKATDPAFCRHDKGAGRVHKRMTTATTRNVVRDVANLAGIDPDLFSPHYFRHDFAIKMLRSTHDLAIVQDMMGHATPASTRVYAKIYPDELQKAHRDLYG